MELRGLSASSYDCYSWCAWKWYLTYTLGFEDKAGPSAFIGTVVHSVLEDLSNIYLQEEKIGDIHAIWENRFTEEAIKQPENVGKIQPSKIKKMIRGIQELIESSYTPFTKHTHKLEQYFRIPIEENKFIVNPNEDDPEKRYYTIRGLIDRVDFPSENIVEIIDYKTGRRNKFASRDKNKIDVESLKEMIQPRMYHMAADKLYPEVDSFIITFIYLTDGGPVSVPFVKDDIQKTKDILSKRINRIKQDSSIERNRTWMCDKICGFGRSGVCDRVHQERQQTGLDFIELKYSVLNARD